MTQVSRAPLKTEIWEKIFNLFLDALSSIHKKEKLKDFLEDFLSPTERIMLSKRFACLVLLAKGHDYTSVKETLHVSNETVAKMNLKFKYAGAGLIPVMDDVISGQTFQIIKEEIRGFELSGKQIFNSERLRRQYQRRKKIQFIKDKF